MLSVYSSKTLNDVPGTHDWPADFAIGSRIAVLDRPPTALEFARDYVGRNIPVLIKGTGACDALSVLGWGRVAGVRLFKQCLTGPHIMTQRLHRRH